MRQLTFTWGPTASAEGQRAAIKPRVATATAATTDHGSASRQSDEAEDEWVEERPYWPPSPAAITTGEFGVTDFGPIEPNDKDTAAMTDSVAGFLLATLEAIEAISDPSLMPRSKLHAWGLDGARLDQNLRHQFERRYAARLSQFADGFGESTANELDAWVRASFARGDRVPNNYHHPELGVPPTKAKRGRSR